VARKISNYLTKETGWTVVFESAIVPKWKDGRISFKKTYISRHPDLSPSSSSGTPSTTSTASHPAHAAATRLDAHYPSFHHPGEDEADNFNAVASLPAYENIDDLPFERRITTFDLEVDSVDVELSLRRWLDGKGLVQNAVVKGVRGVVGKSAILRIDGDLIMTLMQTAVLSLQTTRAMTMHLSVILTTALKWSGYNWRTSSSLYTNQVSALILSAYSKQTSACYENNGYSTICFPQKALLASLTIACLACMSHRAWVERCRKI
jgi:Yeast mitochondrial distribution and morphology (MDM) proteins